MFQLREFCFCSKSERPQWMPRNSLRGCTDGASPLSYPHPTLPRFTSTPPPDLRPQAAALDPPPPPHPNQESPRDARVTQAPVGATNHEQIRAAVSGRDCGWRTCDVRDQIVERIVVLKIVRVSASNRKDTGKKSRLIISHIQKSITIGCNVMFTWKEKR